MSSRYDVTSCWCFTLVRLSVRPWCSLQIKLPTSTTLARLLLFKQIVDGLYLPNLQYIAAVNFVQQFVQTSSAKQVMLNSPWHSLKWSPSYYLSPGGATFYDEFEQYGIKVCFQNKTALKCAKDHANWFRHFEDISRRYEPSNIVAYFLSPCTGWSKKVAHFSSTLIYIRVMPYKMQNVGYLYPPSERSERRRYCDAWFCLCAVYK